MKFYLIGGGSIENDDTKEIDKAAFSEAGGQPKVFVIPWTSSDNQKLEKYIKIMPEYFSNIGAKQVVLASLSDSLEKIKHELDNSDMIYIPGGDTEYLIEAVKRKGLAPLLKSYRKIIVGNSAGAISMCREGILTKDRYNTHIRIVEGFGLVDFSVSTHYKESEDADLLELSKNRKIYAIPEKCAVVWDGKKMKFIGEVYLFYKNGKEKVSD